MKSRRTLWLLIAFPLLLFGGFVIWAQAAAAPMPEALAALASDGRVAVEEARWIVFRPAGESLPETGLILYPGGRVDARAYAPAARAIAAQGYLVVVTPMPLNLAVLDSNEAGEVMRAFPEVGHWAVGGHSLGGSMAANYAAAHPGAVEGLVLWASYPASGDDLSGSGLEAASIYGTRDGLSTPEEIEASRPRLPPETLWTRIEGGNHAQFGWYGPQSGDFPAEISREAQQEQTIAATLALLESIGSDE